MKPTFFRLFGYDEAKNFYVCLPHSMINSFWIPKDLTLCNENIKSSYNIRESKENFHLHCPKYLGVWMHLNVSVKCSGWCLAKKKGEIHDVTQMNRESSSGKSIKYGEEDNRLGQKVNESSWLVFSHHYRDNAYGRAVYDMFSDQIHF